MKKIILPAALALACATTSLVLAQEPAAPETIPFEGGSFTITETPELDKILAYDGKQLARDYVAFHQRTVDLDGTKVAIFAVGGGGNACGPETVLAWKTEAGIQSAVVGDGECGTPPAAATGDALYFVPYLLPGTKAPVRVWSPAQGLQVAGELTFVPQPGTTWADLDIERIAYAVDVFDNADVYRQASAMLGDKLEGVALGLSVSSGLEKTASGLIFATGCVPHACGINDAFIGIDAKARKLYVAKQGDTANPGTWPALAAWPTELRDAMIKSLATE
ncbi:hypothetical protein [Aminobacter sp. HY435]|uniref:hypothetical protein n=1 Tax=Aminobacter sp. HY435 TaxID=2970917 RepID=UPI0022B96DFF|nr:hypothetical protein [Aminobacter sp. HY435]